VYLHAGVVIGLPTAGWEPVVEAATSRCEPGAAVSSRGRRARAGGGGMGTSGGGASLTGGIGRGGG